MVKPAEIKITRGPDQGKVYQLTDELINVGRDPSSQIPLTDPCVAEHQASIIRRNGRYAIYTPIDQVLEVDGNTIPAEQWVWLPESARIRISGSTSLLFRYSAEDGFDTATPPDEPPGKQKSAGSTKKSKASRYQNATATAARATKQRKVAKFITDQDGDSLVRLGEDGALPTLALDESIQRSKTDRSRKEKNPSVLYIALGVSMLMTLSMLFFDSNSGGSTEQELARAKQDIKKFYRAKSPNGPLEPYQRALREAQRAASNNDRQAEFRAYKRVLEALNSEDVVHSLNGLTGDRKTDKELRRLIGILLDRSKE